VASDLKKVYGWVDEVRACALGDVIVDDDNDGFSGLHLGSHAKLKEEKRQFHG
jgi:hypothetical protein